MPDQKSLAAIGFGLSAITALVIVAAVLLVAEAQQNPAGFAAVATSVAR